MPQEKLWTAANKTKGAVALLLTFSAGYVDVVGFVALYRLFVANMTGNTVHFANNLLHANWSQAFFPGLIIGAFVGGSIFGRVVIEVGARNEIRRIATVVLSLEAVLIGLAGLAHPHTAISDIAIGSPAALAFAMGLQTAALTRIGPLTIHTTFVTGMLNKLSQLVSHYLFLSYDRLLGNRRVVEAQREVGREATLIFAIWMGYFLGVIAGTRIEDSFGLRALLVPVGLIGVSIFVDQVNPLSVREEQEQLESGLARLKDVHGGTN